MAGRSSLRELRIKSGEISTFDGHRAAGKVVYSELDAYESISERTAYSLKFVLQGSEEYELETGRHQVRAGQFLIIPPGGQLLTRVQSPEKAKGFCLYFRTEAFEAFGIPPDAAGLPAFPVTAKGTAFGEFTGRVNRFRQTGDSDAFLWETLGLCREFTAHATERVQSLDARKPDTRSRLWQATEKGRQFILDRFREPIDLADMAMAAHLSPFHFQRSFRQIYGTSPSRYLAEHRLACARQLQADGGTLADVAYACGFSDPKYLGKLLKREAAQEN